MSTQQAAGLLAEPVLHLVSTVEGSAERCNCGCRCGASAVEELGERLGRITPEGEAEDRWIWWGIGRSG